MAGNHGTDDVIQEAHRNTADTSSFGLHQNEGLPESGFGQPLPFCASRHCWHGQHRSVFFFFFIPQIFFCFIFSQIFFFFFFFPCLQAGQARGDHTWKICVLTKGGLSMRSWRAAKGSSPVGVEQRLGLAPAGEGCCSLWAGPERGRLFSS